MTTDNDTLSVKIAFNGDKVTREFKSYKNTSFGQAFNNISKEPDVVELLANAFGDIHSMNASSVKEILNDHVFNSGSIFEAQPVPWYLSEFFTKLKKSRDPSSTCSITVKACREHYFYTLSLLSQCYWNKFNWLSSSSIVSS